MIEENPIFALKKSVRMEGRIVSEISKFTEQLKRVGSEVEEENVNSHIKSLNELLRNENENCSVILNKLSISKTLPKQQVVGKNVVKKIAENPKPKKVSRKKKVDMGITELERETFKRIGKKKKVKKKKTKENSNDYLKICNKFFSKLSGPAVDFEIFRRMKKDLFKSHINYFAKGYISMIFFTTAISFVASIFLVLFFMFFNLMSTLPFVVLSDEPVGARLVKIFWIPFIFPVIVFFSMLFYPSAEKKSAEKEINTELPFAVIHMSAVSGSSIEPSKIFTILISTKEYPSLQKEFIKLINEINIHGFDLVTALRNSAFRSPSRKLSELYNGLATTITSGGDLSDFFDQRAQTLLLDYRIEREKETKANETFMDIYISMVIAAPMVFMLMMIMMQISGLGVSLSSSLITIIIVVVVTMINFVFLVILQLRRPEKK